MAGSVGRSDGFLAANKYEGRLLLLLLLLTCSIFL